MEYKPSDFPVGAVDFFSVLLPGALLSYLGRDLAAKYLFGSTFPSIKSDVEGWVAFVFAAYLVGQFVALIGAAFMERLYDKTYLKYKRRKDDHRYTKARELQGDYSTVATPLKWAGAYVHLKSPSASADVDRFEAGSKFFRSIVVVFVVFVFVFLWQKNWMSLGVCVVFLLLSFWRFGHLRWKYTELTFLYFVELSVYPSLVEKNLG